MALAAAIVLAIVSVPIGALSLLGVLFPRRFIAVACRFVVASGIGGAVGIRLLLAALLWLSGPVSSTPEAFRVLALLMVVAAFTAAMLGADRARKLLDRMAGGSPVVTGIPCAVGLAFSAFMLWSVSPAIGGA